MNIVVRRGSLRATPKRDCRDKSILLHESHAEPQAQVHLRRSSADHDGSAASTSEARKCQHHDGPGHFSFDERRYNLAAFAIGASGVEGGNFIDQAGRKPWRGRMEDPW